MTTTTHRPASPKQTAFIERLRAERGIASTFLPADSAGASREIERLLAMPRKATEAQGEPAPAGYYLRDDSVYRVVVAKTTGNLYAKVLRLPVPGSGAKKATWEYAPGIHRNLRADEVLTAEQAAHLGHLHGYCVFCGAALNDVRSEAAGYGSTCAKREGLPYPTKKEAEAIIASRVATHGTRDAL